MALMIPGEPLATRSGAELRLFNRLRRELPDAFVVLHSLGIADHPYKLWGEGDFVVISPLGVFLIEVKGGGVSCVDGEWRFHRSDGTVGTKREGPFAQAQSAMQAVKQRVEENDSLRGLVFGFGVIMPDEAFTTTSPEIDPSVLLDKRNIRDDLTEFILKLSARFGGTRRTPTKPQIDAIRQILRPDIRTTVTVNSSLVQIEEEQVRLTEEQSAILRRMQVNDRTLIEGAAGTGKTLLALDVAKRRAAGGRVLYVCYNRLLARHVNEALARRPVTNLEACHFHGWCRDLIKHAGMLAELNALDAESPEFYTHLLPELAAEAVVAVPPKPFDCLVIDEGQDLLRGPWLDVMDLVLNGMFSSGRWHIFADPNQAIFGGLEKKELERLLGYGCARFRLTVNCRNTKRIAVQTSIVSGIDAALESADDGGIEKLEFFVDVQAGIAALEAAIQKLHGHGVPRNEMIILGTRTLGNSGLTSTGRLAGMRLHDITADGERPGRECIDYATIHSFKGLERRAVLVWNLNDLDREENRLLHYCGLSRARTCLYTFVAASQRPSYDVLAEDFGRRQAIRQPADS